MPWPAGEERNLSSRGRIIRTGDQFPFPMPCLDAPPRLVAIDRVSLAERTEEIEREAYEKGYAAGEQAGLEMGERKAAVLLGRLEEIIADIGEMKPRLLRELEPRIVELSTEIARKILAEELRLSPEAIVMIAREAIRKIERSGPVTVRINPMLKDLFERLKPSLLEVHGDIRFEVDPSVSERGAIVSSQAEEVITDVDEQFRNIVEDMGGPAGGD